MKHTPGPWIAKPDPSPFRPDDYVIGTEDSIDSIAVCSERDAHLIAAAPDLLEALTAALRNIPQGPSSLRWKIEAAIAKATEGEG